jgi:hypothetical protein
MTSANIPLVSHSSCQPCYFTIQPSTYLYRYTTETPLTSPPLSTGEIPSSHLLSFHQPSTPTMASNFLKLQTAAAHGQPIRPRLVPQQNVLHVTSDDSSSSDSDSSPPTSSSVDHTWASSGPEAARCSRCHRTPSIDIRTGRPNVVQFGLNSYYCTRCAAMVGLTER